MLAKDLVSFEGLAGILVWWTAYQNIPYLKAKRPDSTADSILALAERGQGKICIYIFLYVFMCLLV